MRRNRITQFEYGLGCEVSCSGKRRQGHPQPHDVWKLHCAPGLGDTLNFSTIFTCDPRDSLLSKTPDAASNEASITCAYADKFTEVSCRGDVQTSAQYDEAHGCCKEVRSPTNALICGYDAGGSTTSGMFRTSLKSC